jgi:hypothetical protein
MKRPFKTIRVEMPVHDADVVVVFPGGAEVLIQARPSNADVNYNGSLDIILPDDQVCVCSVGDDMEPAPEVGRPNQRKMKQIWTDLPGDYSNIPDDVAHIG